MSAPENRSFETVHIRLIGGETADEETRSQLLATARSALAQALPARLDPEDVIVPGAGGFVIVLCPVPARDLAAEAASLRLALNSSLRAEAGLVALHVELTRETLTPAELASLLNGGGAVAAKPARRDDQAVIWLPMWDVGKEALTTYWLTPAFSAGASSTAAYNAQWMETRVHSDVDFLALDIANLARMMQEAQISLDAGLHCLVGYSVHATTLQDRQRRQSFLARLYETPSHLRRHILGRIAEVEPGTPSATIAEWVRSLRPISSDITLQLHESEPALDALGATGAATASFTLSPRQHDDPAKEYYARHIQRWAALLRRQRILFRLDNVEDEGLLTLALASGAEFFTSERCWPRVPGPAGVRKFPRARLGRVA